MFTISWRLNVCLCYVLILFVFAVKIGETSEDESISWFEIEGNIIHQTLDMALQKGSKRRLIPIYSILFFVVVALLSVMEIGVRDYIFNYLPEQIDVLFKKGEDIVLLKEEKNQFCVINNNKCLTEFPSVSLALKRGISAVGEFFSKNLKRKSTKKVSQRPHSRLPFNFVSLLKKLEQRILSKEGLVDRAKAVNWPLDRDNMRRWLDIADFKLEYQNMPLEDHIERTVAWREEYGACCITSDDLDEGVSNVSLNGKDKFGRPILVFHPMSGSDFDVSGNLRSLIYTVESAIRMMSPGVEKFAVVVDLSGASVQSLPPVSYFTSLFQVLMAHYPMRLGIVLIINSNKSIQFFWKIVNSVLPERIRRKVFFLEKGEAAASILDKISSEMVESKYEL